jgi:hypothetical protein
MAFSLSIIRMVFIGIVLSILIVQINGGYWVCDWVNRRGWMYCSRGLCSSYGKKRNISPEIDQAQLDVPEQNNDGTYCADKRHCYKCEPLNDIVCYLTRHEQDHQAPINKKKRADDDICP